MSLRYAGRTHDKVLYPASQGILTARCSVFAGSPTDYSFQESFDGASAKLFRSKSNFRVLNLKPATTDFGFLSLRFCAALPLGVQQCKTIFIERANTVQVTASTSLAMTNQNSLERHTHKTQRNTPHDSCDHDFNNIHLTKSVGPALLNNNGSSNQSLVEKVHVRYKLRVHLDMKTHTLPLLDAVATREAHNQEDDKNQNQNDKHHQDLHLHVLPPHLAAQLPPSFVKFVSLFAIQNKLEHSKASLQVCNKYQQYSRCLKEFNMQLCIFMLHLAHYLTHTLVQHLQDYDSMCAEMLALPAMLNADCMYDDAA